MRKREIIKVAKPCAGSEEVKTVKEVILSGRYISGERVKRFEHQFARYLGVRHAVAVNSGTAALHTALAALEIGAGDEVIVPPLTFFSTVSSVLHQRAVPVFADIDKENYCIDPKDIERKITRRTKAIIPVHLYGNSADMDGIVEVASKHKLKVVEDAAQAHGTEYRGQKVGSIGDIGIFSFFATKHITTGEGGMLVTNNKKWADVAKCIRNHGMTNRDHHVYLGYNYRMNEMAAAIGIVQLKKLDGFNTKRTRNSLYLINRINKIDICWIKTPRLNKYIKHTFFWCPILIDEERLGMTTKRLIEILRKKGIETRHRYWEPLYRQSLLNIDYKKVHLENVEEVAGKIIGLPNHPTLKKEDLDYIIKSLIEIGKERRCGS